MFRLNKPKPPNAFAWFTRYVADQRNATGHPFRSIKAAMHEAAIQWEKLDTEDKQSWKEKARSERSRFRTDPELKTMTPKEFIAQVCEIPMNGMTGDSGFWSRHWADQERQQYGEELLLLEEFDTVKRQRDRETIETAWKWHSTDIFRETFLFISVQSSSPVEADSYVPETLAIAHFSLQDGVIPCFDFCCALAREDLIPSRQGNTIHHRELNVGDEDGCQARVGMKAAAKLIFQRAKEITKGNRPIFFCLAEEFEVVYDALCDLHRRVPKDTYGRLSVDNVATIEDLAHCIFICKGIPLPDTIGQLQKQLYFDSLMERADPSLVNRLRCGAHESDSLTRCPQSVVHLAALKLKQWVDNGGIPQEDSHLIERRWNQSEWPVFTDTTGGYDAEGSDDDDDGSSGEREQKVAAVVEAKLAMGTHERTMAWLEDQQQMVAARKEGDPVVENEEVVAIEENVETENDPGVTEDHAECDQQVISNGPEIDHRCKTRSTSHVSTGSGRNNVNVGQVMKSPPSVIPQGTGARGNEKRGASGGNKKNGAVGGTASNHDIAGLGGEMEYQRMLPLGARGIGRGMHLVPSFAEKFNAVKSFLEH